MEEIMLLALVALTMSVITIALSYLSWSGSKRSFRYPFIALVFSEALVAWGYFLGASSTTIEDKLLWNSVEFAGYISGPMFFLIFALLFIGKRSIPPSRLVLMFLPGVLLEAVLLTNGYHELFYTRTAVSDNVFRSFEASYGPFFYAFGVYILIIAIIYVMILIRHYLDSMKANKANVGLVTFSAIISLVTIVLNFTLGMAIPGRIIVMIGLVAGSVPLFIGAFSFELFEMVPFANDRVMNTMKDCVIVLDEKDRVLFMNRSAEQLSGNDHRIAVGEDVAKTMPMLPKKAFEVTNEVKDGLSTPVIGLGKEHYEMDVSSIKDHTNAQIGKLVIMRDVTERWNAEEDARITHVKLDLLNTITRHDIRNQLIIIEARLGLMRSRTADPDMVRHIESSLRSVQNIDRQISFAKDYQELGRNALTWQSLDRMFLTMGHLLDIKKVEMTTETGGAEVLADPLLSKVFYNLLDNSIAHGVHVSRISLKASETGDRLDIVYEDDGVGVGADDKSRIFEKGTGSNSGLGLFLSMEILRTGKMDIVEDGTPGRGARFRITVPKGSYRIPGKEYRKG
ncbi:MAG: histidine kinase N-terminal 7TM domain-containing protein [Methanomassiliicoccales archaeon]|jgi:PAS domain S-box-containing protein